MRQPKRPIDAKYTKSSIVNLLTYPDYLTYCHNSTAIQEYWHQPEYMVYPINESTNEPVPVVASNINPGDFFTPDKAPRIGIVTHKLSIDQSMLRPEHWRFSPHKPGGDYIKYQISGDIGGLSYRQFHKDMDFFLWIPLPCQLIVVGLIGEAEELQKILSAISKTKQADRGAE